MTYNFFAKQAKETPQTKPIPGRESEMVKARSGGFAFDAGIWKQLRRALITGTASGGYYAGKQELTDEFAAVLRKAVAEDPRKVADDIIYASDGRSVNNSAPILGLVFLSMGETPEAKAAFMEIFPQVIRTGSHFYEWIGYTKSLRGTGKIIKKVAWEWLGRDDVKGLAYQLLKYQQRQGFSGRDILRMFHVKPKNEDQELLYKWVTKGWDELPSNIPSEALAQIWWYEWLKKNPKGAVNAITKGRLTHEMVAPIAEMNRDVWQLLFETMPIGALLRNLASLTDIGIIRADNPANLDRIEAALNNKEYLRKGRLHPIDLLKALKTYSSGGSIGKSKKTWSVVPRVVDILDKAVELSFETQEPTGKVFMHAVDVSGSMSWKAVESVGLTYCEIATVMALVTAKSEKNYAIRGFADQFIDLGITARDTFASACAKANSRNFGPTDASAAFDWMRKNDFKADVVCLWTDGESWSGRKHPSQALAQYRSQVKKDTRAVYVTLATNNLSQVDPKDQLSYDIGGFDPSSPRVVQMIASGEL